MSVDYAAVPKRDEEYLEILWGGASGEVLAIDLERVVARLEAEIPGLEGSGNELNWEGGDGYIQGVVFEKEVGIAHGWGPDNELLLETLEHIFQVLEAEGLFVWDHQSGQFL